MGHITVDYGSFALQITNKQLSDSMTVAMYKLGALIVAYCPHHIHVNSKEPK